MIDTWEPINQCSPECGDFRPTQSRKVSVDVMKNTDFDVVLLGKTASWGSILFWVLYGFVWSCSVSATCLMHVRSVLLTCNNHGVKIIYLCSTVHGNSHITGIWGKSTRRLAISLGRKTMVQSIATAIATGVVEEALLQIIEPWGHGFQDSKKTMKQKLELSCVWECGIHPLYPFLWQSHGGNVWTCDLG